MLSKQSFSEKSFPFALALISIFTYGLFIPWLGFYWDDWPVLMLSKFFGTSAYVDFYAYDRPFSAWTYIVTAPLLGLNPIAWQLYTLGLRWLTSLFIWLSLRLLWPEYKRQTAWITILFVVHPIFSLQFISVAFSQHWTCFLLYSISMWSMLKTWNIEKKRGFYLALSLLTEIFHLWTMEYFIGMEIFRFVVIWVLISSKKQAKIHEQIITFIKNSLPFAFILVVFILWRLFILELPIDDPNDLGFFKDLLFNPIDAILNLSQVALRDLNYMLLQIWSEVLTPIRIVLASKFFLFAFLTAVIVAIGITFYLLRLESTNNQNETDTGDWVRKAIPLGFLAIILGVFPGWITYRQVLSIPYGNRIALPAMLGLSILIVAFLEWVTKLQLQKMIIFGALVGISVFSHLYTADYFREVWGLQKQFYWQLYWRAPYILHQTAILSDTEVLPNVGSYSTTASLNMIYADSPIELNQLPYWFFNMSQKFNEERFLSGKSIYSKFRNWGYSGKAEESIIIDNDGAGCLQIIMPNRVENTLLSSTLQAASVNANLSHIQAHPPQPINSPSVVFGSEPDHTWCYYYEKAELAYQFGDWETVILLGEKAMSLNFQPKRASEWLVFIDGYVKTYNIQAALDLTKRTFTQDPRIAPLLCKYWQTLDEKTTRSFPLDKVSDLEQDLTCTTQ